VPSTTPAPTTRDRRCLTGLVALAIFALAVPSPVLAQSPYSTPRASSGSQWATQSVPPPPTSLTPASPPAIEVTPYVEPAVPLYKIQPTKYQPKDRTTPVPVAPGDDVNRGTGTPIQLEPPGLERLAGSVQMEETLQERIRQENRERNPNDPAVTFPESPTLSRDTYRGRGPKWAPRQLTVEPYFLCYEKLLTEQKNFERYGWDLGILTPVIAAGTFYLDVALIPYNLACRPFDVADANTGLGLPGDPVPLLLYPPELSVTGTLTEAGVVLALVAMFP
jgi:hypothetical protein